MVPALILQCKCNTILVCFLTKPLNTHSQGRRQSCRLYEAFLKSKHARRKAPLEMEDFYSFSGLIQGLGTILTPRVCTAPASSRGEKEM